MSLVPIDFPKDACSPEPEQDDYDKALGRFVSATVETGCEDLVLEFNELKVQKTEVIKTAFDKNPDKNRYQNVFCNDESRVRLPFRIDGSTNYIHANRIPMHTLKKYICTQGPTPKTNEDFWRMVVQEKIMGIVMLTEVMELGKKKCEQYWPKAVNEIMTHGPVTIKNLSVSKLEKFTISELEVSSLGKFCLGVQHIHVHHWPSFGVPNIDLILPVLKKLEQHKNFILHCSAGIGRTGTIAGLYWANRWLKRGYSGSLISVIRELRKHRYGSVQTAAQYLFMHAVIVRLAELRNVMPKNVTNKFLDEYTSFVKKLK